MRNDRHEWKGIGRSYTQVWLGDDTHFGTYTNKKTMAKCQFAKTFFSVNGQLLLLLSEYIVFIGKLT